MNAVQRPARPAAIVALFFVKAVRICRIASHPVQQGASHVLWIERGAKRRWSKSDDNALLAVKCCIENNRQATSSIGCLVTPPADRKNWSAPKPARADDIVFVLPQGHLNLSAAPNPIQQGASHFWVENREMPLVEFGCQRCAHCKMSYRKQSLGRFP